MSNPPLAHPEPIGDERIASLISLYSDEPLPASVPWPSGAELRAVLVELKRLRETVEAAEAEHDDQECCIAEQQREIESLRSAVSAARDSGPEIHSAANGEAGDYTTTCSGCGEERDEPHTWEECHAVLKDAVDGLDGAWWGVLGVLHDVAPNASEPEESARIAAERLAAAREDLARAEACRRGHLGVAFNGVGDAPERRRCRLCNGHWDKGEPESHAADCLARPFEGATDGK